MEVAVFVRAVGCARLAAAGSVGRRVVPHPRPPSSLAGVRRSCGNCRRGRNAGRGGKNLLVVRILFHYREKSSPAVFAGRLPTVQIRCGHVSQPTGDRTRATKRKCSPHPGPLPADWARGKNGTGQNGTNSRGPHPCPLPSEWERVKRSRRDGTRVGRDTVSNWEQSSNPDQIRSGQSQLV